MSERDLKPYPYAQPRTFEFLKAAITQGAHLKQPNINNFRETVDVDAEWIRIKNVERNIKEIKASLVINPSEIPNPIL